MDFDMDGAGDGSHHFMVKDECIQCSACKQEMPPKAFQKHNTDVHNMLSWVEGAEPVDLTNEKLVLSILNKVLRGKKRKFLCCDVCGEEKKSALGFFTHKQTCGKTEEEINQLRVSCEICGRTMMPVSLRPHMLSHERKNAAAEELDEANIVPEDLTVKKSRRVAATRAKSRMTDFLSDDGLQVPMKIEKQSNLYSDMETDGWDSTPRLIQTWRGFISLTGGIQCLYNGCMYRADSVETAKNHLSSCEFYRTHDKRFLCNICLLQRKDESDIAAHVQAEHEARDSDLSADMNSTSDNEATSDEEAESPRAPARRQNRQSYRPKPCGPQRAFNKLKFLQNTVSGLGKDLEIYNAALNWTLEFRLANYSEELYLTLSPVKEAWSLVQDNIESYLPSTSCSIPIEFRSSIQNNASDSPYQFTLFEGQIIDDVSTFFTGGPVWAMEWCPIPMQVCVTETDSHVEYLAVSTHHSMDDTFCVSKCYSFPNVIQIWDCCSLSSESVSRAPKLALALAHNYGTVWSLAWCPSGAYDHNLSDKIGHSWKRMGLLAAACSSGDVLVFSIPFPNQLKAHTDKKVLPVYKSPPSLRLITNFAEPSQCTRVAWYQGRGHGLVAGGFCNGMVALWDLITLPPLLWDAQHHTLRPFQCIQAHLTVISALSFNPEYDGRFFMTGSHDRSVKFWDMEDLSAPITHHKRGYVTDGVWLNLWISSITSYDDAFQHEHTNSTLHPVRDFGYKPYPLLTQNSVAWCLSYNEWINATAQGSEAGEIVVTFSSQLMIGLENEKNAIDKRIMASYTLLKKLVPGDHSHKQLGDVVLWQPEPKKKVKAKEKKTSKSAKGKSKQGAQTESMQEEEDEIPASLYTPDAILQDRNPQYYSDIEKNYGLCVHDTVMVNTNKNKLPEEAKSRVRLSGRMHPTCSDFYPITSINKIAWNPNIGRFFWLASGHQCGLVKITGMHFMQNPTSKKFLSKASEAILTR